MLYLTQCCLLISLLATCTPANRQPNSATTTPEIDNITLNQTVDGYRGIWYSNQPSDDVYRYKYSGGLGTYPSNHYPFAVYAPEAEKTFFCYGGTDSAGTTLLHMVSYYDHRTGTVARPTLLLDKHTDDAHDNPVLNLDEAGYVWIFSTSHGTERPSYVHRSRKPYDVSSFERIRPTKQKAGQTVPLDNFSYLQIYHVPDSGFFGQFTHYHRGVLPQHPDRPRRTTAFMTSPDGVRWSAWQDVGAIEEGHYQTSGQQGRTVGTAFNYHPAGQEERGLNLRTNLYYTETRDFGHTWQTANGTSLSLPLTDVQSPALVADYAAQDTLVYIHDVNFDTLGRPIILYLTSGGFTTGPENGPRRWRTAHWNGAEWDIRSVTTSDNNYNVGSLYVEDGRWRIIGPTEVGPQAYNTGGEVAMWISTNQGKTWQREQRLTEDSPRNHSYVRRPLRAHPEFYALWADGHGRQHSASVLYFADQKGRVYQLPPTMSGETSRPRRVLRSGEEP